MEIYKIIAIAVVSAVVIVFLRSVNSELASLALIAAGILVIIASVSYVTALVGFFSEFTEQTGVDSSLFSIVLKIIAISYLVEFSAGLIEDFGLKSLSDKVVFAGKMLILTISVPIIKNIFGIIGDMI